MKRMIFAAATSMVLFACGSKPNQGEYFLHGTVDNGALNGKYVYVAEVGEENHDSVMIVDGKFVMEGAFEVPTIYRLSVGNVNIDLATENSPLELVVSDKIELQGEGAESHKFIDLKNNITVFYEEFRSYYMTNREATQEVLQAKYEECNAKVRNILDMTVRDNGNSLFSAYALMQGVTNIDNMKSLDSIEALVPLVKNIPLFVVQREFLETLENVKVGSKFVDFEGTDMQDKAVKLSDYVGKGNYVLVDFWASWCGPCKREIPNLREVYEKHKANGLVLLGVNVWDKKDKFLRSVEHENMNWNHIYASHNNDATDRYAINGIPCIMLFSPDGTIVNRTMRQGQIMEVVDSVYGL